MSSVTGVTDWYIWFTITEVETLFTRQKQRHHWVQDSPNCMCFPHFTWPQRKTPNCTMKYGRFHVGRETPHFATVKKGAEWEEYPNRCRMTPNCQLKPLSPFWKMKTEILPILRPHSACKMGKKHIKWGILFPSVILWKVHVLISLLFSCWLSLFLTI